MDATPANRLSVGFNVADRRRSRGLSSDHRGICRAVMVEFYTTVHMTCAAAPPPSLARLFLTAPGSCSHTSRITLPSFCPVRTYS